jgi:hypothetical protein
MRSNIHGLFAAGVLMAASLLLGSAAVFAAPISAVTQTAPGQNKIQCFDGTTDGGFGGTCTLNSNGAKGSVTLSNASTSPTGDYSGVYTLESVIYGQPLTDITQLSYHYDGTIAPNPGNLSYNIPIDTNADGTTDFYAFIDAYYCGGVNGVVDIINDPNCGIYAGGVTFYPNWSAFVGAYPGAQVATDNYVFIVAERTGTEPPAVWTISNIKFGKGGK